MEIENEAALALEAVDPSSRYELEEWARNWAHALIGECRSLRSYLLTQEDDIAFENDFAYDGAGRIGQD